MAMPADRLPTGLTRRQMLAASAGLATLPVSGSGPALAQAKATGGLTASITVAEQGLKLLDAETRVPLADPALAGRFRVSDTFQLRVKNSLNVPLLARFRGFVRAPEPKPEVRPVIAASGEQTFVLRTARPGTMLAEFGEVLTPLVVDEAQPPQVDRDEVMLVEEWRVRGDGSLVPPDADSAGATTVFTLNRKLAPEIAVRRFERLRFRFINGSQRSVIALRIENANAAPQNLRVIAIDSRPAEAFPARNGQIALAPTSRLDALIDASGEAGSTATLLLHDGASARPLARLIYGPEPMRSAPLPEAPALPEITSPRPDLRNAQRFELVFDGTGDRPAVSQQGGRIVMGINPPPSTGQPAATGPVAFRAHRSRTVSLALTNKSGKPAIFRLHDHSGRLLDRMDDGWKPYWVDTIPVDAGQTQRIAFVPENSGTFIIDAFAPEWGSVQRRWSFVVEV